MSGEKAVDNWVNHPKTKELNQARIDAIKYWSKKNDRLRKTINELRERINEAIGFAFNGASDVYEIEGESKKYWLLNGEHEGYNKVLVMIKEIENEGEKP